MRHREGIDRIDKTIAALLAERSRIARLIGEVAYQGAPGAFSEEAARALVGPAARLRPCATLADLEAALTGGIVQAAVVPVENSLAGAVPGSAEILANPHVRITGECRLPIAHALIGAPGVEVSAIRRVFSHPMALAQCARFFLERPAITPVPAFDTAGAVADVIRRQSADAAAIGSRRAADMYGGVVLAEGIQDSPDNITTFLLIESRR